MRRIDGEKIFEKLYQSLKRSRAAEQLFPQRVGRDIAVLGASEESYYVQKLKGAGAVLGILAGLIVLLGIRQLMQGNKEVKELTRPEAYEETQELVLQAGAFGNRYEIELAPLALTQEQTETMLEEMLPMLESCILGSNQSLEAVKSDLYLAEELEGYPFEIYWESDREDLVDATGKVNREGLKKDEAVVLTAVFTYHEWSFETSFGVVICKEVLTEEERYGRELGELLRDSEEIQRGNQVWRLPETFQGEALLAYEVQEDFTLPILLGIVLVSGTALWVGRDFDLKKERDKRRQLFQEEYMSFVESLSLYIASGATLQGAMQYCVTDYARRRPEDDRMRKILLEYRRDMDNGCGFSESLERFAAKTDAADYKRLAGMLKQGQANGSAGLAEVLEQEAEKIREEKRRCSKVRGEQVSTALIAPMMLQLGIVIALIMIPAFTSMQF